MPEPRNLQAELTRAVGAQYRIERELGGGGMSRVFVARDTALEREVVIKVLAEHLASGVSVERFKREILVSAGLQHPHIVPVLSAGDIDGLPYFIMPFVEGASLRGRILDGPLPIAETVSVLQDVARALAYAHARGVVHRDVKPGNVLLSHGAAVLTDFGVAKALRAAREEERDGAATLTQEGVSLGTPTYMAPEQAAGETTIDHRADLYAFGVLAYEMLSGKPPFDDRSITGIIAAHLTKPPPPLEREDVPAGLRDLIMTCLEKEPDRRPQDASAIVEALDRPEVRSGSWGSAPGRRRGLRTALAGVAGAAVLALVMFLFRPGEAGSDVPERSIAVLPFVNVGGDTADVYFADGMTDELITALQSVSGLRVASRTAVFALKGHTASPAEIGERLSVSTLLEGTVRRGGDRLRLTAQLVDADDGFSMWSETYEADAGDVFAVQDSIARAIAGALRERFGDRAMAVEMRKGTDDLEAYDHYLRGRHLFGRRGEEALRRAIAFFEEATARDPAFADAWAGLADAYSVLPLYSPVDPDSVLPLGLAAANRAVALDSTLAAAYAARGSLHQMGWQWPEAERDYRRALALDPEYATAHQWLGELQLLLNRPDSAVAALRRATELDPVSAVMAGSYAGALGKAGRHEEAIAQAREALALADAPVTRMFLAATLLYVGRDSAAAAVLEPVVTERGPVTIDGLYGYALARQGRTDSARAILARLDSTPDRSGHAAQIARIHLGFGQRDAALAWLESAVEDHDVWLAAESLWTPIWAPLHDHPRFVTLLRRINLARYR